MSAQAPSLSPTDADSNVQVLATGICAAVVDIFATGDRTPIRVKSSTGDTDLRVWSKLAELCPGD